LRPRLYIAPGLELNAYTVGVQHPMVVINMGALQRLTLEEVGFVLGHELGHIKSSHVLYFQMGEFLPLVLEIAGRGIGNLLGLGLQFALLRWKRTSELTADRAGLLACQNQEVALRTLMKMAGLPPQYFDTANTESFIIQAREFQALDADKVTVMAKHLGTMGRSHPWTIMRARELLDWIESGGYHDVMLSPQKDQIRHPPGQKGFCIQCGSPLHVVDKFCSLCGTNAGQT
jgi:Zn-dependent protease with chaperone function